MKVYYIPWIYRLGCSSSLFRFCGVGITTENQEWLTSEAVGETVYKLVLLGLLRTVHNRHFGSAKLLYVHESEGRALGQTVSHPSQEEHVVYLIRCPVYLCHQTSTANIILILPHLITPTPSSKSPSPSPSPSISLDSSATSGPSYYSPPNYPVYPLPHPLPSTSSAFLTHLPMRR